jgi:hypothetical protein
MPNASSKIPGKKIKCIPEGEVPSVPSKKTRKTYLLTVHLAASIAVKAMTAASL